MLFRINQKQILRKHKYGQVFANFIAVNCDKLITVKYRLVRYGGTI